MSLVCVLVLELVRALQMQSELSGLQGIAFWEGSAVNWIMVSSPFCAGCWRCTKVLGCYPAVADSVSTLEPGGLMLFCLSHQISLPCKYPPLLHPSAASADLCSAVMGGAVRSFWLCSSSKAKYQTVWEVLICVHPSADFWALSFNVLWERILLSYLKFCDSQLFY